MIWTYNSNSESIFPVLSDAVLGTYNGILVVNGREIGDYSCSVTHENGENIIQRDLIVSGKYSMNTTDIAAMVKT